MQATTAGSFTFTTSAADILPQHNVLLFDRDDAVPPDQIEFRNLTLNFVQPVSAQTNPRNSLDVNDDTAVSPVDALLVINELNFAASPAARAAGEGELSMFLDVNSDGAVSPLDALLVINELNRMSFQRSASAPRAVAAALDGLDTAEGESTAEDATTMLVTASTVGMPVVVDLDGRTEVFEAWEGKSANDSSSDLSDLDAVLALLGDDLKKRPA
jgi:hypothetical protein